MQQFYVLLPYAGALVAGISAVWALARMSRDGARLRSYVYEETVAKLPLRCLLTGVFAALATVGECMDVFLNGGQGAIWYAVLFTALAAAACCGCFLPQGTPSGRRFIPKNPTPGAKSKKTLHHNAEFSPLKCGAEEFYKIQRAVMVILLTFI